MSQLFLVGKIGRFEVTIIEAHTGNPMTGLTPTATITKLSNNTVFDYSDSTFKAIPTNPNVPLTEDLPINTGTYYFDFDQEVYDSPYRQESYNVVYTASPHLEEASEINTFMYQSFIKLVGRIREVL